MTQTTHTIDQQFSVAFDYPVSFTRGLFQPDNPLLANTLTRRGENHAVRTVAYLDEGLASAQPKLAEQLVAYAHAHPRHMELVLPPQILSGGQAGKGDYDLLQRVMGQLGDVHLDRQSVVLVIGGGSLLDAVGLAVSLVHRGLRLVRCPSTVLGQNDAGVGVKNGLDEHGQKNFIGTFAPPFAVLNDLDLLETLSDLDWRSGIAEAFKVAMIKDASFFDSLCASAHALRNRDGAAMESLIVRTAELHLEHIRTSGDAFEMGTARPLDFGHWLAHWLEIATAHELSHGQAVSIGLAVDAGSAVQLELITPEQWLQLLAGLLDAGLPIVHPLLTQHNEDGQLSMVQGLEQFREHLGGLLNITLPCGIGNSVEVHTVESAGLERVVYQLMEMQDAPR